MNDIWPPIRTILHRAASKMFLGELAEKGSVGKTKPHGYFLAWERSVEQQVANLFGELLLDPFRHSLSCLFLHDMWEILWRDTQFVGIERNRTVLATIFRQKEEKVVGNVLVDGAIGLYIIWHGFLSSLARWHELKHKSLGYWVGDAPTVYSGDLLRGPKHCALACSG